MPQKKQTSPEPERPITKYIVKKAFRYGKKMYKPGEEFMPSGGKFDKSLITHHCNAVVEIGR